MQTNNFYNEIIEPFIQGQDTVTLKKSIELFISKRSADAIKFIQIPVDNNELSILSHFMNQEEAQNYLLGYKNWLRQRDNNLIHLLEFLAQYKSPRLRYLLKQIQVSKIDNHFLQIGICFFLSVTSLLAFMEQTHPHWLEKFISSLFKTIAQTSNLALIIFMYQIIKFMLDAYYILNNNATTSKHKQDKLLRNTVTTLINVVAQILIILNPIRMSGIANNLLVVSQLINLLLSAWTLYKLKKIQPLKENPGLLENLIQECENQFYVLRKTSQFRAEFVSLFLSFTVSIMNFIFISQAPWLGAVSLLLQFFISQINNLYHSHLETKYTDLTQKRIKEIRTSNMSLFSPSIELDRESSEIENAPSSKIMFNQVTCQ